MQERSSISNEGGRIELSSDSVSKSDRPGDPLLALLSDDDLRRRLMREMGSRGGKKGGKARASALTSLQRQRIAKHAAEARWKRNERG
jgi:hypothetical protein